MPRSGRALAFSLVELLVVIAVIALLVALVVPALAHARHLARLSLCQANIRSQALMVLTYASDSKDAMPPSFINWNRRQDDGSFQQEFWTLPRFLADYDEQPFTFGDLSWHPAGVWRCPEIAPEQDAEYMSDLSVVHSASNTWLYNSGFIDDETGDRFFGGDSLPGWESIAAGGWRRLSSFSRPADLIAILDVVTFSVVTPEHRHARESVGRSWQLIPGTPLDNRGTHPTAKLPCAFLDGHGQPLPLTTAYWNDAQHNYNPPAGGGSITLYDREVERFIWYVR